MTEAPHHPQATHEPWLSSQDATFNKALKDANSRQKMGKSAPPVPFGDSRSKFSSKLPETQSAGRKEASSKAVAPTGPDRHSCEDQTSAKGGVSQTREKNGEEDRRKDIARRLEEILGKLSKVEEKVENLSSHKENVEQLNTSQKMVQSADALAQMYAALEKLSNTMTEKYAPAPGDFEKKVDACVKDMKESLDMVETKYNDLAGRLDGITTKLNVLESKLSTSLEKWNAFLTSLSDPGQKLGQFTTLIGKMPDDLENMKQGVEKVVGAAEESVSAAQNSLIQQQDDLRKMVDELHRGLEPGEVFRVEVMPKLEEFWGGLTEQVRALQEKLGEASKLTEYRDKAVEAAQAVEELKRIFGKAAPGDSAEF